MGTRNRQEEGNLLAQRSKDETVLADYDMELLPFEANQLAARLAPSKFTVLISKLRS